MPAATTKTTARAVAIASVTLIGGLLLSACSSSSHKAATAPPANAPASSASAASAGVTVKAAKVGSLGTVLVGPQGATLYMFEPDKQKAVTCKSSDGCTTAWPPLVTKGAPKAGPGVEQSLLGTIRSASGPVVTYNGWPLYTYADDSGPGVAVGQGVNSFGGLWYVMSPAGSVITSSTGPTPSTSGSGSGGYSY